MMSARPKVKMVMIFAGVGNWLSDFTNQRLAGLWIIRLKCNCPGLRLLPIAELRYTEVKQPDLTRTE